METANALGERLTSNADRICEGDGGVLIGSGAPDFAVRHELTPNLSTFDQRPMVADGNVGDSDPLRHRCMLTVARNIQEPRIAHHLSKQPNRAQQSQRASNYIV
jgi:hypothetical protein